MRNYLHLKIDERLYKNNMKEDMDMDTNNDLKRALDVLHTWAVELGTASGHSEAESDKLWSFIQTDTGILREFAYYHDRGEVLGELSVQGYTLADIMVWQIDHFRSHMDRLDNYNKHNQASLLFDSFTWLVKLRQNPEEVISQFSGETGTDLASGWTIG
jgi:hypothetical protein